MEIAFLGAAREVTGSMHLLSAGKDRILFDCGMFQGRRKESDTKNRSLPFEAGEITNMVLSHAHIDHSGRIPLLTKKGFTGRILCTRATADACGYLLMDSAHIQEMDAKYLNYKTVRKYLLEFEQKKGLRKGRKRDLKEIKKMLKKGKHELDTARIEEVITKYNLPRVTSLYTQDEVEEAVKFLDGYPYDEPVTIGKETTLRFYDAGHILGSAFCLVTIKASKRTMRVCYTGDMGRFGKPILHDPTLAFKEEDREIDLLILESTYGNRFHPPVKDLKDHLEKVLNETHERGGSVIIPSFAYGRTQELIYFLHELYRDGRVKRIPVFIDSPLATNLTKVFGEHPEVMDQQAHETFLERGDNPFAFKQLKFVASSEESMALMQRKKPHIVISGSGMCEAGRILHHLRYKIHNENNTILVVGYMAENTLGRRILEAGTRYAESGRKGPPPSMKFLNKHYPLSARVVEMGGFSAHGDRNELCRLVSQSNLRIKKIALVHGEEEQTLAMAKHLESLGHSVMVPRAGEKVVLNGEAAV